MPPSKIRFVTACQQLLALGLVVAVLTPAASVVSLDVVHDRPDGATASSGLAADLSAYVKESSRASEVPAQVVDPTVTQYDLTASSNAPRTARTKADLVAAEQTTAHTVTSVPEPVVGYGAVGVTWEHGVKVPEDEIALQVRTRTGQTWSKWMDLDYDADHGPDPGTAEAKHARPGTDALLVGDVDDVQVQVQSTTGELPPDLKLAVIDPGKATRTAVEHPALDTDSVDPETPTTTTGSSAEAASLATDPGAGDDGSDRIALQAATFTPKPKIYSRAQWGADEKMRDKSSLHYFEVHAGFVHHTVNANDYSRAEVPGILRSIYAYHTKSRGWSDIGYNFLVDRFGRIWEGRYGGIDRPVVGAHTLNYNDYAFAMSAIGNYDIKQPSSAMVQAYGALFAWKLSLHGVNASSTKQQVGKTVFQAINGHRDAASTACPGKYLYARIPDIRKLAAAAQRGWAGRELESNLASTPNPDIVARRSSDGRVFVIPTGGLTALAPPVAAANGVVSTDRTVVSPDLTGDGRADLVVQAGGTGVGRVRPGTSAGTFGAAIARPINRIKGHDLVTAVGDVNADGRNDLVARVPSTGQLDVLLRKSNGAFRAVRLAATWGGYNLLTGIGDVTGDGHADLLARDTAGRPWLIAGTGKGKFRAPVALAGSWSAFASMDGLGDFTGDGKKDLFVRTCSTGYGYVYPGRGDGTFGHSLGPLTSMAKTGAVVGVTQVVRDGTPDVVVRSGSTLSVLGNYGGTETRAPIDTGVRIPKANALFNAGDWDRDGHGDIISRNSNGDLELRRGNGTGRFGSPTVIGTGFSSVRLLAAVGDMTGDGWPDLMGQPSGGAIRIYPGAGMSGLRSSYVAHGAISASAQVPVGRWTSDGAPDSLFTKGGKATLYPGNGPGGLTKGAAVSLDLKPYNWVIGISDIGITGHADLVVRRSNGYLYLIPGSATGFGKPRFLASGMGVYDLAG
ncbi:FG-GAP-like repeat-containing protein [Nocardioides conyzicola]|uniref:Peptidoglycan recognition protein family domain-containing protein n=1 Tax=Nocardioides conyzicola TaxID=1651781 RepID=A0ABP8WVQ1_9ACTN